MCSACFCIFPRSQDRQPMCSMCFCVFSYKALKFKHGKTPTCFLCFCVFPHPNTLQFTMAMCSMCFCVFLSTFNLDQYLTWANAPCVLFVFVFFAQVAGHITNVFMCFNFFWLRSTGAEMIPKLKKGKVGPVDCASNILHAEANIFSLTSAFEITIWLVREKRIQ